MGGNCASIATALHNLATLYTKIGRNEEAIKLFRRCLPIKEAVYGPDHPQLGDTLSNLAGSLTDLGHFAEAERLTLRCLAILQKAHGTEHPFVAIAMNRLAMLYEKTGNFDEAETEIRKSLDILKKLLPKNHPFIVQTTLNLAGIQISKKDWTAGKETCSTVVAMANTKPDAFSETLILVYDKLAFIAQEQGDLREAEKQRLAALALAEKALGSRHPHVGVLKNNLTVSYLRQKEWAKGEAILLKAGEHMRETVHAKSPEWITFYGNLACAQVPQKKYAAAFENLLRAVKIQEIIRPLAFQMLPNRDRIVWNLSKNGSVHQLLSLLLFEENRKPEIIAACWNALLQRKCAALEAGIEDAVLRVTLGNKDLGDLAKAAEDARRNLVKAMFQPGASSASFAGLEEEVKRAESTLAKHSALFAQQTQIRTADLAAIDKALPEDAALISFDVLSRFDFESLDWSDMHFIAFVKAKGDPPKFFDLGAYEDIHLAAEAFRNASKNPNDKSLEPARKLSDLLFKPLWNTVKEKKRWWIAPDSSLLQVPFACIPLPGSDELFVSGHDIGLLNSGREIAGFADSRHLSQGAVILADPDFDAGKGTSSAKDAGPAGTVSPAGESAKASNPFEPGWQPAKNEKRTDAAPKEDSTVAANRSIDMKQVTWTALPGTGQEAEALLKIFRNANIETRAATRGAATKTYLLDLKAPRFLHIATHGFFLADQPLPPSGAERGLAGISAGPKVLPTTVSAQWSGYEDPMIRSGLVLAGANGKNGIVDGVVTAQEIAGLNLWGTELVTLSACESGLGGHSKGEGVLGLRRSFLMSGARSVVLSLWKVPDSETKDLMAAFYKRILAGTPKGQALREAMLEVREQLLKSKGSAHPYYWGAFILIGDPN